MRREAGFKPQQQPAITDGIRCYGVPSADLEPRPEMLSDLLKRSVIRKQMGVIHVPYSIRSGAWMWDNEPRCGQRGHVSIGTDNTVTCVRCLRLMGLMPRRKG